MEPIEQEDDRKYVPPSLYEERFVAFLDILGWREVVERSRSEITLIPKLGSSLQFLKLLSERQLTNEQWAKKLLNERGERYSPPPEDLQFSQFSDCIVVSTLASGSGEISLCYQIPSICKGLLYQSNLLVRGGVTRGPMYHKGAVAFGPALTRAYDLERQYAKYPRVILDSTIAEPFAGSQLIVGADQKPIGHFYMFRQLANDPWLFFDYLMPMGIVSQQGLPNAPYNSFVGNTMEWTRNFILDGIRTHAANESIQKKYLWLKRYYNEVVRDVSLEYPSETLDRI